MEDSLNQISCTLQIVKDKGSVNKSKVKLNGLLSPGTDSEIINFDAWQWKLRSNDYLYFEEGKAKEWGFSRF